MISFEQFFSYRDTAKTYDNWKAHIKDYMLLLDMVFQVVADHRQDQVTAESIKTVDAVLCGKVMVPSRSSIDIAEYRTLVKAMRHIVGRENATLKAGGFLPIVHVGKVFLLSGFERFCMIMSFVLEVDRKYERLYGFLHDNPGEKLPTVGAAASIYSLLSEEETDEAMLLPTGHLFRYILDDRQVSETMSRLSKPMRLNDKILSFLMDKGFEENIHEPYIQVEYPRELPKLRSGEDIQERLRLILDNLQQSEEIPKTAIYLCGLPGSGKRLQVRLAANYLDMPLVMIDCAILKKDIKKIDDILKNILRCTILYQGLMCIYNFEALMQGDESETYDGSYVLNRLGLHVDVLFVLSADELKQGLHRSPYTFIKIFVDLPVDEDRLGLWKALTGDIGLAGDLDLAELSNKFHFTMGMMEKALREASLEVKLHSGGVVEKDVLYKACIRQSSHQLERKATKLKTAFGWEDLILPEEQKQQLKDACNHIRYKHVVLNQWGFEKKLPYGKGLGILFYGPPGTGKTMGAQVLAQELDLEIYRVDLSQTVSKYIGETEKNLKEIFDEASRTSAILFFDEADSLFGKRGEVKDAHDRYANMETSYLLQKMEEYEGVTILATNLLQNFDEAYRRRFKFLINFPMPDEKNRRQIWQSVFPQKLPLGGDVDLDFLARQFELSGSNIKNIAVAASFLAAGEGMGLQMRHLVKALKNEWTKAGKIIVKQDLGGYGDLL